MRYSKSFIPIQACNPCTWCYFESDFITEDEYLKSVCFGVTITFVSLRMQCGNTKDAIIIFKR